MSEKTAGDLDADVHGAEKDIDELGTEFTDALGVSWIYWFGGILMAAGAWYELTNNVSPSFVGELVFGVSAFLLFFLAAVKFIGRWHAIDLIQL
jgi:hypothetical protein